MELIDTTNLTEPYLSQVHALIAVCQRYDNLFDMPYLANQFNFYQAMPAFVLMYEQQQLIGFAGIYAATDFDANATLYIHPKYRRQGFGRQLFIHVQAICRQYNYVELVIQTEGTQLVKMPWLIDKFQLTHDMYMSEILMQWQGMTNSIAMSDVEVRLIDVADVKPLAKIHAHGFDDTYQQVYEDLQLSFDNNKLQIYVFLQNKKIIGSVTIDFTTATTGFLFGYVIKKQFQGRGLGQQALARVLHLVAQSGIEALTLAVNQDNVSARHVYQKLGFIEQSTLEYLVGIL